LRGSRRPTKLHLKLRPDPAEIDREAVFAAVRKAGGIGIRPLFPDSPDPELASFYTIDVKNQESADTVMKFGQSGDFAMWYVSTVPPPAPIAAIVNAYLVQK
jgi:hypothetical protein